MRRVTPIRLLFIALFTGIVVAGSSLIKVYTLNTITIDLNDTRVATCYYTSHRSSHDELLPSRVANYLSHYIGNKSRIDITEIITYIIHALHSALGSRIGGSRAKPFRIMHYSAVPYMKYIIVESVSSWISNKAYNAYIVIHGHTGSREHSYRFDIKLGSNNIVAYTAIITLFLVIPLYVTAQTLLGNHEKIRASQYLFVLASIYLVCSNSNPASFMDYERVHN